MLSINKVSLIGGGVDEAPMAYKDIRSDGKSARTGRGTRTFSQNCSMDR